MSDRRINLVNIDLIKAYWRNPRRSDDAIPFVANSISRYGFNVPIVVDSKNVIILGHTRYRAARQLNLKEVPVIVADLTDQQAREFRIADNKTSEMAKWDPNKLVEELRALSNLADVDKLFGTPEWDAILHPPSATSANGEPASPTQPNDLPSYEVMCPHCGKENRIAYDVSTSNI